MAYKYPILTLYQFARNKPVIAIDSDGLEEWYVTQKRGCWVARLNPGTDKSVDPLAPEYPFYSPCHFAGGTPIQAIDLDGLEPKRPSEYLIDAWDFFTDDNILQKKKLMQ